ncbi:hypothetical protein, partial [Gluconobacter cerinus]|uniref:hypothetical protein n=1 Tax=Gluconobacter cerinus TaxID=38307 RepID=UPI0024E082BB
SGPDRSLKIQFRYVRTVRQKVKLNAVFLMFLAEMIVDFSQDIPIVHGTGYENGRNGLVPR